ncbi:beta-N-acetylhexosaminidase [Agromyces rhizosphaerae]|uniref:beta-N-acetylhexosaminidase n=1 Tax=Agromyces rhizosphaerae TaxID=88374 RepID=A0A9W6FQ07_9MICO|nr:beta-N-acetylhexosaminidase [Agromyces rhizosphaerae]GLI28081.1 beta-N-acetylhexosaminidase [Agromyces rhizosphaerae]
MTTSNRMPLPAVIPAPVSLERPKDAEPFELGPGARIVAVGTAAEEVAGYLAQLLRPATGSAPEVVQHDARDGDIVLALEDDGSGDESYRLDVDARGIRLIAPAAAGLFFGVQTLRQLLPVELEASDGPVPVTVPAVRITDAPRFAYRGVMLDVARHFLTVEEVERLIDEVALLKVNHLHLHLTDDQGWRVAIDAYPALTGIGASTSVDGRGGGHYSKADYARIVAHAAARHLTVVPEIDLPGHTHAALTAVPELNPDGVAPAPYEGVEVGFSGLDPHSPATWTFVERVLGEVAAMTPGPYLHLGGDETLSMGDDDYLAFVARASAIAAGTGKAVIGWHELGRSRELPAGTIGQYWSFTTPRDDSAERTRAFVEQGGRVILSPADVAYLDISYPDGVDGPEGRPLGQDWADGPNSLADSYGWDPERIVPGLDESDLLGIEAPLWTETVTTLAEAEWLLFPRLAAVAEIAWSPATAARDLAGFDLRLDALRARLAAMGVACHGSEPAPHRGIGWAA